jgi:hypothetical protein
MKDQDVIAHQARKIAELEVKVSRGLECERQLLAILRSAGIEVVEMELNREEAEFLQLYRNASPEGKAIILAKAELAAKGSGVQIIEERPALENPGADVVRGKQAKKSLAENGKAGEDLGSLPKAFFKRTND